MRSWGWRLAAAFVGGHLVVQAADDTTCEGFATDPVVGGRFVQLVAGTESSFRWTGATQHLEAVLDVDASPAYYLSNPLGTFTDTNDCSFSVSLRIEDFDPANSPAGFIGLMTTTHVGAAGDGIALVVSAANGRLVAHAVFEAGTTPSLAGDGIPLVPQRDYLAVGRYRAAKRELAVEVFDGNGFTNLVGFSTRTLPPELRLRVDRLGLQNDGARLDVDPTTGSITLIVDDLCSPADFPNRLSLSPAVLSVREGDTGSTTNAFTVSLLPRSSQVITVDYRLSSAVARSIPPNVDYAGPNGLLEGTLRFAPDTATVPLPVIVFGDRVFEPDEPVTIELWRPDGAVLEAARATLNIVNDDLPPVITIATNSVLEGDAGRQLISFTVTVAGGSELTNAFHYRTVPGPVPATAASADVDYVSTNGWRVLPPGLMATNVQFQTNVTVEVIGDLQNETRGTNLVDLVEEFQVLLDELVNLRFGTDRASGLITDDDSERFVWINNEPRVVEGPPGRNTNLVFEVRLSRPAPTFPVTVGLSTLSGTATEERDFRRSSPAVLFPTNVTQVFVPIEVIGDDEPEADEFLEVFLRDPSPSPGVSILPGRGRARGWILDDDPWPVISLADLPAPVEEPGPGGSRNAVFVANLSFPVSYRVDFTYTTEPGTATPGPDFVTVLPANTNFPPNTTRLELPVVIKGDGLDEEDLESFWLRISNVLKAKPETLSARGWIRDTDPLPELRLTGTNVVEGDDGSQEVSLHVSLWPPSGREVRVIYTTRDGTATTADADYQQRSRELVFAAGDTNQFATVVVYGDRKYEADERFCVRLSNPTDAIIREPEGCVTITNNDVPTPTLSMADVSLKVTEGDTGATAAVFVVQASLRPEVPVIFRASTLDGTAWSGADFVGFSREFTLPTNTTRLEIPVEVEGDTLDEDDEYFTLRLSEVRNAEPFQLEARGVIEDDDPLPGLHLGGATVIEGNSGTRTVSLPVTLSTASGREVRVTFTTTNGTARAERDDYVPASGVVTIPTNQTSASITLTIRGDLVYENDEEFCVVLSNPVNATITTPRTCVVITNDDPRPELSVADLRVQEGDSGTTPATFVLRLTRPSEVPVSLRYETRDGTALAGSDYVAGPASAMLTFAWNAGTNTVSIPVIGDRVDESPKEEFFTLRLFDVTTATPSNLEARCTIVDNDGTALGVQDVPEIVEGDTGTKPAQFRVQLTLARDQDVSFDYVTQDGSARTNGLDYTHTFGRATIPKGSTSTNLAVPVRGDTNIEPNEVFYLAITNITGLPLSQVARSQGQCTILDDDTPTVLLPVPPQLSVVEGDEGTRTNVVIPVLLSWPARADVVLRYRTRNGTATGGADFDPVTAGELRIPTGSQSNQVVVPVTGDNLVEGNETFDLVVSEPVNAILTNNTVTVTIVDDDLIVRLVRAPLAAEDCLPANGAVDPFETVTLRVTVDNPGRLSLTNVSLRLVEDEVVRPITHTNQYGPLPAGSSEVTRPFTLRIAGACGGEVILRWEAYEGTRFLGLLSYHLTLGRKPDGTLGCCVPVDLRLTATGIPDPVTVGSNLVYTVRVANAGPSAATTVVLTNRLDKQVRVQEVAGAVSFATNQTGDVICALGTLEPQADVTVRLTVTAPGIASVTNLPGQLTSLFVVGSTENDQAPGDNSTSIVTRLVPPIGFSVSHVAVREGDDGTTTNAVFTVWRWPGGNASTVQWSTQDGSAAGASDFTAVTAPRTISFAAGQTANTNSVVVTVQGDNASEDDETFSVVLANASDGQRLNDPGVGTILDDDVRPVLNSPEVAEGREGDRAMLAFTVALSAPAKAAVQFRFATADGTATLADADYVPRNGPLSWAAGESHPQPVPVTVIGDDRVEADETVLLQAWDPSGRLLAQTSGLILNDDRAVFIAAVTNVVEGGVGETNHLSFLVALTPATAQPVTCEFRTADGTATVADRDYLPVVTNNLVFPANTTGPLVVRVPVVGDSRRETNETVVGYLTNAVGAALDPARSRATNLILNDECLAWPVAVSSTITAEACRPANQAVDPFETVVVSFTLRNDGLAATTNLVATLLPETAEGYPVIPLTPSRNYGSLPVGGTLSRSFTNRVEGPCGAAFHYRLWLEDQGGCPEIVEFPLQLGAVRNGVAECCCQADVVIQTNVPPKVAFGQDVQATVSAVNRGQCPVTGVLLRVRLPEAGQWSFANSKGNGTLVGTLLTCSVDRLAPGEALEVRLVGAGLSPGPHSLSGTVAAREDDPDGGNNYFATTIFVELCDGLSLQVQGDTVAEGEPAIVTVRLQPAANRPVEVWLRTADGTATAASGDYEPLSPDKQLLVFSPGLTVIQVPIPTFADLTDEPPPDECFTVFLSQAIGATICADWQEAQVCLRDTDPPCLAVGDVGVDVGLAGDVVTQVPVWLSSAPGDGNQVTVHCATRDGTAVAGPDYRAVVTNLVFGPTDTRKTIPITVRGNTVDEGTEYFYLDLTNAVGATYCQPTGRITITNQVAPCFPTPCGLVAWWSGETNLIERALGLSTVKVGPGQVSFAAAKVGGGMVFDGTCNLETADSPSFALTNFTIEAWIRCDGIGPLNRIILCKGASHLNETVSYSLMIHGRSSDSITDTGRIWGLDVPGTLTLLVYDGVHDHIFHSHTVVPLGQWVHVAATVGPDTVSLYLDGTLDVAYPREIVPLANRSPVQVGGLTASVNSNSFVGVIDELSLYHRALTPAALHAIYAAGAAGKCLAWQSDVAIEVENPSPVSEGVSGGVVRLRVRLSSPPCRPVRVQYSTADQTATAGVDYVSTSGVLAFEPGQVEQEVAVAVLDDTDVETPAETFEVRLAEPVNASLERARAVVTILDNDICPPTLAAIPDLEMHEDRLQMVHLAVGNPCGPLDALEVNASTWNPALIPPSGVIVTNTDGAWALRLTPAQDQFSAGEFGDAWILVTVDNGAQTVGRPFKARVRPVNDPPSFQPGPDPEVTEDAGAAIFKSWATAMRTGPSNESDQHLKPFRLTTAPASLFAEPPTIDADGTLRFVPAANAFGTATVTVELQDDGGTDLGGVDIVTDQFLLAVRAVNDPPTLDPIADRSHPINAPVQTVPLSGITTGAANETQRLEVTASSDNPGLIVPTVSYASPATAGTLSYLPRSGQSGTATITVTVLDDGDTANGGGNQITRQFRIAVSSNTPPVVSVTNPRNGQHFDAPAAFPLEAEASDSDGTVTGIEWFQRSASLSAWQRLGQVATAPYRWGVSNLPAGAYEFYAQANDNDGAQGVSQTVRVEVTVPATNPPPVVRLVRPLDGQLVARNRSLTLVAEATDSNGWVASVEFYQVVGGQNLPINQVAQAPFQCEFHGVTEEAEYVFVARATDNEGATTWSDRVSTRAVGGDILLIRHAPNAEIEGIQRHLEEPFKIPSATNIFDEYPPVVRVLDEAVVNPDMAAGFRVLLWSDLGREDVRIPENVVETLWHSWNQGLALYLIGEHLAEAGLGLSPSARQQWTNLTGIVPASGRVGPTRLIRRPPEALENELFDNNFPRGNSNPLVTNFCYPRAIPRCEFVGDGQVRAEIRDTPVLIRYPRFDQWENPLIGPRLIQRFLVMADRPELSDPAFCDPAEMDDSLAQRRVLFQNAIIWLLGARCDNTSATPETPTVGGLSPCIPKLIATSIENGGGCEVGGVVVTQHVPDGLQVVGASILDRPEALVVRSDHRLVFFVGQVASPGEVWLHTWVVASRAGQFTTTYDIQARFEPPTHHEAVIEMSEAPCDCPRLEIEAAGGNAALTLRGQCPVPTLLEVSPDLIRWTAVQTNPPLQDGQPILTLPTAASAHAYYRLVMLPEEDPR